MANASEAREAAPSADIVVFSDKVNFQADSGLSLKAPKIPITQAKEARLRATAPISTCHVCSLLNGLAGFSITEATQLLLELLNFRVEGTRLVTLSLGSVRLNDGIGLRNGSTAVSWSSAACEESVLYFSDVPKGVDSLSGVISPMPRSESRFPTRSDDERLPGSGDQRLGLSIGTPLRSCSLKCLESSTMAGPRTVSLDDTFLEVVDFMGT